MLRRTVLRPIDDPKIFPTTAFYGWLDEPAPILPDELKRLYHHALASRGGEFFPPCNAFLLTPGVVQVDNFVRRCEKKFSIGGAKASQVRHMPHVVFIRVHRIFAREQVKGSKLQICQ